MEAANSFGSLKINPVSLLIQACVILRSFYAYVSSCHMNIYICKKTRKKTSIPLLYPLNPSVGSRGAAAYASGHRTRGGVHLGQVASPTKGHTETNKTNNHTLSLLRTILETPVNLTCMFLDGGRKPENPERTHAYTGRTCKLHTERTSWGLNLEPSCCESTVLTTVQPEEILMFFVMLEFPFERGSPLHFRALYISSTPGGV